MVSFGCWASIVNTCTSRFSSRLTSARPTPARSSITITRLLSPSATPVGLHRSIGGRSAGTGTRRGTRSASVVGCPWLVVRGCACFWSGCNGRRATNDRRGQIRPVVADELDDAGEGRVIAQPQVVLAWDGEGRAHRSKGLGLLDRVDAQIGF